MSESSSSTFRDRAEAVSGSVWRCLRRFGVPPADADDCFQSVLLQLHARWDRLGLLPVQELRSYACCVAIGVARGAARRVGPHRGGCGGCVKNAPRIVTGSSRIGRRPLERPRGPLPNLDDRE